MTEFTQQIEIIRSSMEVLRGYIMQSVPQQERALVMEDVFIALDNLQLLQEQTQTGVEVMDVIQEELISQSEYFTQKHQYYYDAFNLAPDAYLLTNAEGVILEANLKAACSLKTLQQYLIGKPLVNFIPVKQRSIFRSLLKKLAYAESVQEWDFSIHPHAGKVFDATLLVAPVRDTLGKLVSLRICVQDITKYKRINNHQSELSQLHIPLVTAI